MRVEAHHANRKAEHDRDMRLAWAVRAFKHHPNPTKLLRELTADPAEQKPLTDEERARHADEFAAMKRAAGKHLKLVPLVPKKVADG